MRERSRGHAKTLIIDIASVKSCSELLMSFLFHRSWFVCLPSSRPRSHCACTLGAMDAGIRTHFNSPRCRKRVDGDHGRSAN